MAALSPVARFILGEKTAVTTEDCGVQWQSTSTPQAFLRLHLTISVPEMHSQVRMPYLLCLGKGAQGSTVCRWVGPGPVSVAGVQLLMTADNSSLRTLQAGGACLTWS